MPYVVRKRNNKFRVMKKLRDGRLQIAKTKLDNARDGGGHRSRAKAERQARAMESGERRRR